MRTWVLWIVLVGVTLAAVGCHDVIMTPRYSALLDQRVTLAKQYAEWSNADKLTPEQTKTILGNNAVAWEQFRFARDGKDANGQ